MRRPGRRLPLLAADLEEVGSPFGTAAIQRGRAAVPAAGAGDGLCLVLVLVDDVLERLDRRRGLHRWATVHSDSCAVRGLSGTRDAGGGPPILPDSGDSR